MKISDPALAMHGALEGEASLPLWRGHLKRRWFIYLVGAIALTLTNVTEVLTPKVIQWTIESFSRPGISIKQSLLYLLGLFAMQFVARVVWRQTLAQQTHRVASTLKSVLWDRARYFPKNRLERDLSPGELMNVATGDIGNARYLFGFTIVGSIDFVFLLLFTIAAMLTIDWQLTLCAVGLFTLLPLFLDRLSRKESRQHTEAQEKLSQLTDLAAQSVATIRLQRLTRSENFWQEKLRLSAADYRAKRFGVVATSLAFIPITGILPLCSYAILIWLGVHKVLGGQMTIGAFVAMQSYIFLIEGPLLELGTIVSEWQRSLASLDRVTHTLAQKEESQLREGGLDLVATAPRAYEIRNLSFAYPGQSQKIFDGFNLDIKQGERIGITGPVGAGKSTLITLLAGLEKNYEGALSFMGHDIRSLSHASLRSRIACVPQKSFLFADTIRANLLLHRNFTDAELWSFLEVAGIRADIEAFPDKLDTKLGEWGINLSGGQKQRLTLARALAGKPEILLLDDCLSAVDTVTEEKILAELDVFLRGSTLVWVAHRDSTLRHCDRVLKLGESGISR